MDKIVIATELQTIDTDSENGRFLASFAFDNKVTDYLQIFRSTAFESGQKVPFRVNHPARGLELMSIGIGAIEISEGKASLNGEFSPDEYGQKYRKEIHYLLENGITPYVSMGIDGRTLEVKGRDSMTETELNATNEYGEKAQYLITKVGLVNHLALVDSPGMPGSRVENVFEAVDNKYKIHEARKRMLKEIKSDLLY